ncbi:MAG TPA: phosphotransferase [Chitinophagaceae bacterium]|jgi:Ser/Thr protein kinase RdoA (MazF antagonist)|nr:phosphotransferase [Chitinophagaceae bacterium]
METAQYHQALEAATADRDLVVAPVTTGLINKTFKVIVEDSGEKFLLQQINTVVFPEPEKVQDNYQKIWSHLYHEASLPGATCPVSIPAPREFLDGSRLFCDHHKRYWRLFEFIDNTQTIPAPVNHFQAKTVAQTFGAITASFAAYDISSFHTTVPGFHDLSLRFGQFRSALHSRQYDRLQKAAPVIEQLKRRERYVSFYEVMISSEEFLPRLMHHDAKISNILFNEETGNVICPVDFDTCMPGYFFSDLGDMIRSMAGNEDENNTGVDAITIRKDYYQSILDGYLEIMSPLLTNAEKKYIHYTGLLMIYMQALRFMTDYLQGDTYYYTHYPDQNFDRARNQLVLLQKLEEFLHEQYNLRYD